MKRVILILSLVIPVVIANAQQENAKQPCFKVTSFGINFGFAGAMSANSSTDYYHLKNVVEDPDLFIDISGYKNGGPGWGYDVLGFNSMGGYSYYSGESGNGNMNINLGLTPYSKRLEKYRDNRELRINVTGSFGTRNNFYYYKQTSFPIDTLQSINGNQIVYADSSITKHYHYSLKFSEINFGLSYLFKTDVNRRFHFYAGIGVSYGIALHSYVDVYEDDYRSVYYYNDYNKPSEDDIWYDQLSNSQGDNYTSTTSTNLKSPMQFIRIFVPIGAELKLSKKPTSFFNHVDLYSEINPGVEFQMLGSEKTYANPYFGMGFIGVRYHW